MASNPCTPSRPASLRRPPTKRRVHKMTRCLAFAVAVLLLAATALVDDGGCGTNDTVAQGDRTFGPHHLLLHPAVQRVGVLPTRFGSPCADSAPRRKGFLPRQGVRGGCHTSHRFIHILPNTFDKLSSVFQLRGYTVDRVPIRWVLGHAGEGHSSKTSGWMNSNMVKICILSWHQNSERGHVPSLVISHNVGPRGRTFRFLRVSIRFLFSFN